MMADGSAAYTKALGLELDLTARGLGVRCQRFSMVVDDGVVKTLNVEAPGKYEVSDAETMLKQLLTVETLKWGQVQFSARGKLDLTPFAELSLAEVVCQINVVWRRCRRVRRGSRS